MQDLPGKLAIVIGEISLTYLTPSNLVIRDQVGEMVDCDQFNEIPTPHMKDRRAYLCVLNGHTHLVDERQVTSAK
jgi:hypothetical protein